VTVSIIVSFVVFLMGCAALCAALVIRELMAARSIPITTDVQAPRELLPIPMAPEVPPARPLAPAEVKTAVLVRRPVVDAFDGAKTMLWQPRLRPPPPPFMTRYRRVQGTPLPRDTDEFDADYTEYTEVDERFVRR
jgi:hypothetical protein